MTPGGWACPERWPDRPSGCVTLGYERTLLSTRRQRRSSSVPAGQGDKGMSAGRTRLAPLRKPSQQCAVFLAQSWQFSKTKTPSFGVTTHSPMLLWTISHAAWVLTRYNVSRDTRMTPCEKLRGQKLRKEILSLGEQVPARRPGANANQLLQPCVTGFWVGRV